MELLPCLLDVENRDAEVIQKGHASSLSHALPRAGSTGRYSVRRVVLVLAALPVALHDRLRRVHAPAPQQCATGLDDGLLGGDETERVGAGSIRRAEFLDEGDQRRAGRSVAAVEPFDRDGRVDGELM